MRSTIRLIGKSQNRTYGQRVILTLKKKEWGSVINSLSLVDSFHEWQLINDVACAQGIIFLYKNNQILIYLPKMGMCPHFQLIQIENGIWKLAEEFMLPENLCHKLNIKPFSQLKPGFYYPIDLGGHLVFRLAWTNQKDVFFDY